ncbi:hypothetical protein EMQU_2591 [Enterococcus mundtii QU 25]|uniref:Uncharacterized protein n=1 Tax=Enterococcus mundtii TaxID=53346 RepID=A0A1V2UGZ9_ENTMU|nr:hypothetical protein BTN92_10065 [Enterococcus mundtii]BAO08148.1 hypothetical protein EMQU_2591 [Enterococcus mundtii QU 25]
MIDTKMINECNNITKELQKDKILNETEVYDFTIRKSKSELPLLKSLNFMINHLTTYKLKK